LEKLHDTGSRICVNAEDAAARKKRIARDLKSLDFIMNEKLLMYKDNQ
jgi:hypothetical protein